MSFHLTAVSDMHPFSTVLVALELKSDLSMPEPQALGEAGKGRMEGSRCCRGDGACPLGTTLACDHQKPGSALLPAQASPGEVGLSTALTVCRIPDLTRVGSRGSPPLSVRWSEWGS